MWHVAVVGAGGLVGRRVAEKLAKFPEPDLTVSFHGHRKSVGATIPWRDKEISVRATDIGQLSGADYVILCTPSGPSRELYAGLRGGPVVIDISSAFRMDPDVPLIVPEVNPHAVAEHKGLIAGPNCSTIPLTMVLGPIHRRFGLKRVSVSTYQAASGVGFLGMEELREQTKALLQGKTPSVLDSGFPHRLAFNLVPQVDSFLPDGYTKEEMKMTNETRKILELPDLPVSATCVRVPVFIGHSEACLIETEEVADIAEVRGLLAGSPGIVVQDDPSQSVYPMPIGCAGTDEVYVGRIRKDISSYSGILLWLVSDNVLRGAATNAVETLRLLTG